MAYLILFSMLFLHLIADYNFQGILAQFKQRNGGRKIILSQNINTTG